MNINENEYNQENPFGLEVESDFHSARKNTTIQIISQVSDRNKSIRILDVGCGIGLITKMVASEFPKGKIDAIDIVEKAIIYAQADSYGVNFSYADGMQFKGFGYLYDVILLNNIYEHIENPCGLLKNLKNLLSENGVFIISTPNRYFVKNILRKIFGLKIAIPKYHITEYSIGQIYDQHLYAGLKIKQVITPTFNFKGFKLINFIAFKIIQPIIDYYLKLMKSKTRMGSLLFIVSSK